MAKLHNPTVGLLLTVLLLLQGSRGDSIPVFSSAGGAATLPCKNGISHDSSCSTTTSSITWIYSGRGKAAVEKVQLGKIIPENTHRAERLSLLSNCSLHITDVTTEDVGLYICQQYPNGGSRYGYDAPVYLSVLYISSTVNEREAGSDVNLLCTLKIYADRSVPDLVRLSWVGEGGDELQNTSSLQIRRVTPYIIRLIEKFRTSNPTHTQSTRRCQLTAGGHVHASVSHTVTVPVKPTRTPVVTRGPAPPQPATPPQPPSTPPKTALTPTPTTGSPSGLEAAIRLSIFFMVLIVPGLIGTVYLVRRRKQTSREDPPATELQVRN
ncbi:uncharacterized protein LOC121711173 [Alosa sapidissima]|uniref:uncharacterized protein LOC121711173 n=1 Tax=Alosa sapidissima TaxID=34773 RepID=UPI001C09C287|nr:uncharacterized protein LOC121711173 [Alosa sapidissima]